MNSSKIMSSNVGSSSSLNGLLQLLEEFKPLIVLAQEISISSSQLNTLLGRDYQGICNNDAPSCTKPGTAFIWSKNIEVTVVNLIPCRLQKLTYEPEKISFLSGFVRYFNL